MRVNIIGLGVGRELSPPNRDLGPRWGINETILYRPVDLTFDMHDVPAILSGEKQQKRRTVEKLKQQIDKIRETKTFFYSLRQWPGHLCEEYPIRAVARKFNTNVFTGSISYAIALALYECYDDIHLYGMNFTGAWEYRNQLPGVYYWIGRAHEVGCNVTVHGRKHSKLLKYRVYGYDMSQEEFNKWTGLS